MKLPRLPPLFARWAAVLLVLGCQGVTAAGRARQFGLSQGPAWPTSADRVALVIGVDDYLDPRITKLKGAVNDARRLSAALIRHAGFSEDRVFLMTSDQQGDRQPTRANILERLRALRGYARGKPDVLILFAFAGHGIERADRAFLLGSDARDGDVDLLEETAISVDRIKHWVKQTGARQAMFILDSCRTNPAGRSTTPAMSQSMMDQMNLAIRNTGIDAFVTLYATAPGSRAYETPQGDGYFTMALVEGLAGAASRDGEVTLGRLIEYVRRTVPDRVMLALGADQKPYVDMRGYRADELVIASTLPPRASPPPIASAGVPREIEAASVRVEPRIQLLERVYFQNNSSKVLPEAFPVLASVVRQLKVNAAMKLEISGYSEISETWGTSNALSERRALAVKKYLVTKGISASRLIAVPGPQFSLDPTEVGRATSRRVEFRIISGGAVTDSDAHRRI